MPRHASHSHRPRCPRQAHKGIPRHHRHSPGHGHRPPRPRPAPVGISPATARPRGRLSGHVQLPWASLRPRPALSGLSRHSPGHPQPRQREPRVPFSSLRSLAGTVGCSPKHRRVSTYTSQASPGTLPRSGHPQPRQREPRVPRPRLEPRSCSSLRSLAGTVGCSPKTSRRPLFGVQPGPGGRRRK